MNTATRQDYDTASEAHRVASTAYRAAAADYQNLITDDATFEVAMAAYKAADEAFDAAWDIETERAEAEEAAESTAPEIENNQIELF